MSEINYDEIAERMRKHIEDIINKNKSVEEEETDFKKILLSKIREWSEIIDEMKNNDFDSFSERFQLLDDIRDDMTETYNLYCTDEDENY